MKRFLDSARRPENQKGFTLVEVMFALVYLSVGLLAIAAMQNIALSRNNDAKRMSIATSLAVEMTERVRFNSPNNSTAPYPYNFSVSCSPACTGGTAPTTTDVTALGDYNQWRAHLAATDPAGAALLPSATGTVTSAALGPAALGQVLVTVTVSWTAGIRTPTITFNTVVAPL